jgi:hypothetical protein
VVVAAVDDGDVYRKVGQALGRVKAGKAAAGDYHARADGLAVFAFWGFG